MLVARNGYQLKGDKGDDGDALDRKGEPGVDGAPRRGWRCRVTKVDKGENYDPLVLDDYYPKSDQIDADDRASSMSPKKHSIHTYYKDTTSISLQNETS